MKNNYTVYQHVTPDGFFYFGATQNVEKRWSNNGSLYKRTALQPYIEKFGWDNIQHIVLFRDQTKENALWVEDFLIETAQEDGVCINKKRSGNISKEEDYNKNQCKQYYETNKGQILERHKQYYKQNKDKRKNYLEQNKDKIREQRQQRYQKNREKELKQQREYYQKNRDEILEQRRQRYQRKKEEQH